MDWKTEYEKELKHWREIAATLSDCLLMLDAHEAGECAYDTEMHDKAMELADMFKTATTPQE